MAYTDNIAEHRYRQAGLYQWGWSVTPVSGYFLLAAGTWIVASFFSLTYYLQLVALGPALRSLLVRSPAVVSIARNVIAALARTRLVHILDTAQDPLLE